MKVKDLIERLKKENPESDVIFHRWNNGIGKSTYFYLQDCVNGEWQKQNNVVMVGAGPMIHRQWQNLA